MTTLFRLVVALLRAVVMSKADLTVENLALRQQIAVFKEKNPRPRLGPLDRVFWVWLRAAWPRWVDALIIVKPETVVRWHRMGFRLFWRWRSRVRKGGRPRIDAEIRDLIRRMAIENHWGASRIHGELLKLGFNVNERTVSRYVPKRPVPAGAVQRWKAFLRNHADGIAAMDFLTVPTATFAVLYVFVVIRHARREIAHIAVTQWPTANWIVQQLREAFPWDTAPRHLILDRDDKFSAAVLAAVRSRGIQPARTSFRCPWQNPICERWIGSCRRELLDHVVVLGENHLRRLLAAYVAYHHDDRCHLALDKDAPLGRPVTPRPGADATVVAPPRVGGIHHRYEWCKAA